MTTIKQELQREQDKARRNVVPVIYTRGTHYEIGFDVGKTFAEMIREHVDHYWPLNETYMILYETQEGKGIYDETLACVEKQYSQYVREIRGTADGSGVPFHKLFLMHLDDIITIAASKDAQRSLEPVGCSAVVCNQPGQEILGHNEDALSETLSRWYLIDAHINEPNLPEEKFCSLSYAGFLPGYTMGYNQHGLVFSVNTLYASTLRTGKTPRYFLARALLGAETYTQLEAILRNDGHGAAEGFSVNLSFHQEVPRTFRNIEVAPAELGQSSSKISTVTANPGEYFYHCNKYLQMLIDENPRAIRSSIHRGKAIEKHSPPETLRDVVEILSDQSDEELPVYRELGERSKTICTGVFDLLKKTWAIYIDKPDRTAPVIVLPMFFKNDE
ncbi:beta-alanyl-dopamine/carcinine hydrolase-like [Phymastichus coffea]|uniref:beta-alanyl-dopamine/carcinine hydrolase-like n=1 Tax=Phymastichus coffea TaxID=108790 RepID=UPI00273C0754|nr:beta-alanyl-dopamine/carcinine hydrolase-like [Phymastichus coffea]